MGNIISFWSSLCMKHIASSLPCADTLLNPLGHWHPMSVCCTAGVLFTSLGTHLPHYVTVVSQSQRGLSLLGPLPRTSGQWIFQQGKGTRQRTEWNISIENKPSRNKRKQMSWLTKELWTTQCACALPCQECRGWRVGWNASEIWR